MCQARPNHLFQSAQQVQLALPGVRDPAPWYDSGPEHPHSLEHNLDERCSLKKRRFDKIVEARINGSTYPIVQPHNRQPEVILGVP
jgi:hypothetical protein